MDDTGSQITETIRNTRYVFIIAGVLYIDQMMVLILCMVFTWSAVRHSRILLVNTLFVFVDISYRVTLQILRQIPRSIQTRVSCEYSLPIKCFSFLLQDGEESIPSKQNSSTKSCRKTMCTSNRNVHYSVHFYLCRISLVYYSARNAQTIGCNNCTFALSPKQTLWSPVCSSFANNHTPKYLLHSCVADICHGRHCSSYYAS